MAQSFKVHHATPEAIIVQLHEGGFGRITAASLGGDLLAERLLKHMAVRPSVVAVPRRLRDDQGYLVLGCSLEESWSGVLSYPANIRSALCELYRKHQVVPLGGVQHARVVRSTAKGTIYSLSNGITAVAPQEKNVEGIQTKDVRVVSYDTTSGAVTVHGNTSTAPAQLPDIVQACQSLLPGQRVRARVVAVGATSGTSAEPSSAASPSSSATSSSSSLLALTISIDQAPSVPAVDVLAFLSASKAMAVPRLGAVVDVTIEFSPSSKELAELVPFLVVSDRAPFDAVPAIRTAQPATRTSGKFPWRDDSVANDSTTSKKKRRDGDEDDKPLRKRRLEEAIDAFERQREEDVVPKSPDEFQKLLLATPNSSYLWAQYMAFHLGLEQFEEARNVAEKALRTIGVRSTKELMNIWVAYLNLENAHGTAESLTAIFRRALRHTDNELIVHEKLADIFKASKKNQQLLALCRVMTTKFRNEPRVWERLGITLIETDKREQLKRVIKEMGDALKKQQQCLVVEHLAIHEYRHGHVANGRALFEGLVGKLPKQSDLWSVFLDQEVGLLTKKATEGNSTFVRDVFERVTSVGFSAKVMQQLLTRYLGFEQTHGTPSGVEKVKAKARAYVEGKIAATGATTDV